MLRHMEREEPQGEENGEPVLQCQVQQAVASAAARWVTLQGGADLCQKWARKRKFSPQ